MPASMEPLHGWPHDEEQPRNQMSPDLERKRKRSDRGESSRSRTVIACRACRDRKTRCSGDQPACNYCRRAGIECVYIQGCGNFVPQALCANFDEWGNKILKAVDQLAGSFASASSSSDENSLAALSSSCELDDKIPSHFHISIESRSAITGISSILAWEVFTSAYDTAIDSSLSLEHTNRSKRSQHYSQETAGTSKQDLMCLLSYFLSRYLPAIPILDADQVGDYIARIGENGLEWSTESCLVLLVAALSCSGQQEERSKAVMSDGHLTLHGASQERFEVNATAFRYWNMAKKRLGWALEESGLLSAQCLCLAGVWYLREAEPASAWKMFHGAVFSINSVTHSHDMCIDGPNKWASHETVQALGQHVLEVCLKYQCELQSELSISIPPSTQCISSVSNRAISPDQRNLFSKTSEGELCFRSAEMRLLQIRQSTLACFRMLHPRVSWKDICALNDKLSTVQRGLDKWYASLPSDLSFPISRGPGVDITPADGYHKARLQYRYFEIIELILRPSLYICLNVENASTVLNEPTSHASNNMMRDYVITESRQRVIQHQIFILLRLKLIIISSIERSFESIDGVWFNTYDCLLLALLLLAPHRRNSGMFEVAQLLHASWSDAIDAAETLLRSSDASGNGEKYASLLHALREE